MFDPFTLALFGGGIGALLNKNPLKGAAMGAGMGALGGYAAPMLGAGGVAGGTGVTANGLLGAGMGEALGSGVTAGAGTGLNLASTSAGTGLAAGADSMAAQPGLFAQFAERTKPALAQVAEYAKPIGTSASAAMSVKGLLDPQGTGMQAPQPMSQTGTGAQTLAQIVGQNQQAIGNQMQMAEQERLARRRQGFMGGLL